MKSSVKFSDFSTRKNKVSDTLVGILFLGGLYNGLYENRDF